MSRLFHSRFHYHGLFYNFSVLRSVDLNSLPTFYHMGIQIEYEKKDQPSSNSILSLFDGSPVMDQLQCEATFIRKQIHYSNLTNAFFPYLYLYIYFNLIYLHYYI